MLNVGALQRTFVMGGVNGKPLIGYNKPAKKMAWWWYEFGLSLPSDLREKTYVITGTTTGTGRCAAMALAERSARVICLNRPSERAVESLEAIKEAGAEFNAKVEHIDCDLSSFDSVKSAIAKPMPALAPDLETMAVLMPINSPRVLTRAPPELPGLIAASVWM